MRNFSIKGEISLFVIRIEQSLRPNYLKMKSFVALAVISMLSVANAGVLLGGAALSSAPITTTSLSSPLTSLHQTRIVSAPLNSGLIASPSWVGSPLLTRTISTHGAWGSPWVGSPALLNQPTIVDGGLVGAHGIW
ncbi:uncharacterized protein LOC123309655 [Coccinella septempunctata]|uniref:uncharacterized protein LOC123309655 n=1 Tax=Coccinella septempunctata TaxID=41139 RepID=UPI001D05F25C|nr:uncharacterized protein LOC123309655 [Coccinella septempunctata]